MTCMACFNLIHHGSDAVQSLTLNLYRIEKSAEIVLPCLVQKMNSRLSRYRSLL